MNTLFGRFRGRSASPLESELRAARPEPPAQLVQKIVGTLEPRQTRRASAGLRLAWASALTVALVAALAATGGLVYAASAVVHATRATHVFQSAPTGPPAAALSSSCSQYGAVPTITGVSPSAAF